MYTLKSFENGFEYIEVVNDAAHAKIALQGAHIFEYAKKGGTNLLWLSELSAYEKGVAIRGGIPLCWPRFGSLDSSLQQHGFARTELFELVEIKELDKLSTQITLRLSDTPETRKLWNHKFSLELKIIVSDTLTVSITTKNLDEKEFMITQALHTYFKISNIENVTIKGLEDKYYFDALLDERLKESQSITIAKEIDRIYEDTDDKIFLIDLNKKIRLQTIGSASTVVWNPWIDKCSRMSYMSKNGYKDFICIESANAFDDFVMIKSKKNHTLSLTISF